MAKQRERFAVFDLETNGFKRASALSASSMVFDGEGRILDFFNRFYYPEERPNPKTEKIHGLLPGRITHFRGSAHYPLHFLEDWRSLTDFWDRWSLRGIIVHNLTFDTAFLPPEALKGRKWWCSMKGLTEYCRIPGKSPRGGPWKWPRQQEASAAVKSSIGATEATYLSEKAVGPHLPHFGLSDCFELYGIFTRIWTTMASLVSFRALPGGRFLPPAARPYSLAALPMDSFVKERLAYGARLASVVEKTPEGPKQEVLF